MTVHTSGYQTVLASDVLRDGMALVLVDEKTGLWVAEVFYSDVTHEMTLSTFQAALPLSVLEWLIASAKQHLPPSEGP